MPREDEQFCPNGEHLKRDKYFSLATRTSAPTSSDIVSLQGERKRAWRPIRWRQHRALPPRRRSASSSSSSAFSRHCSGSTGASTSLHTFSAASPSKHGQCC